MLSIIEGLSGINLIGADIVEVVSLPRRFLWLIVDWHLGSSLRHECRDDDHGGSRVVVRNTHRNANEPDLRKAEGHACLPSAIFGMMLRGNNTPGID